MQPLHDFTTFPGLAILALAVLALSTRTVWLPALAAFPAAAIAGLLVTLQFGDSAAADVDRMAISEGCQGPMLASIAGYVALATVLLVVAIRRSRTARVNT